MTEKNLNSEEKSKNYENEEKNEKKSRSNSIKNKAVNKQLPPITSVNIAKTESNKKRTNKQKILSNKNVLVEKSTSPVEPDLNANLNYSLSDISLLFFKTPLFIAWFINNFHTDFSCIYVFTIEELIRAYFDSIHFFVTPNVPAVDYSRINGNFEQKKILTEMFKLFLQNKELSETLAITIAEEDIPKYPNKEKINTTLVKISTLRSALVDPDSQLIPIDPALRSLYSNPKAALVPALEENPFAKNITEQKLAEGYETLKFYYDNEFSSFFPYGTLRTIYEECALVLFYGLFQYPISLFIKLESLFTLVLALYYKEYLNPRVAGNNTRSLFMKGYNRKILDLMIMDLLYRLEGYKNLSTELSSSFSPLLAVDTASKEKKYSLFIGDFYEYQGEVWVSMKRTFTAPPSDITVEVSFESGLLKHKQQYFK